MRRILITATLVSGIAIAAGADPVETLSSKKLDQVTAGAIGGLCGSSLACSGLGSSILLGAPFFGSGCAFGSDDCSSSQSSATASDGASAPLYNFPTFSRPVQTQDLPDLPGPTR